MGRALPSMTALLGLLAVAGYQNRDKLAEMLGGIGQQGPDAGRRDASDAGGQGGLGDLLGRLGGLGGVGAGGILSGGLGELIESFREHGEAETIDSWVAQGPNRELSPAQLEKAVGPEVLETLAERTGMPRDELVARLTRELPDAVDRYTPEGRLPSDTEFGT